jgi:hypothetical protein
VKDINIDRRAKSLDMRPVPSVVIDGKLVDCCSGRGVDEQLLRAAGVGGPSSASAVGWLEKLKTFAKYQRQVEALGGFMVIIFSLYTLNAYYFGDVTTCVHRRQ